jgi:hypothetical protein
VPKNNSVLLLVLHWCDWGNCYTDTRFVPLAIVNTLLRAAWIFNLSSEHPVNENITLKRR